ncbi:transmembrane protein, putative [Bodo saltans]|uniref:Transmembrane protein, putative n=1 Tax=Bodo saltans TaxID=75058 RepID=A0A0S4ITD1_BODSA|nr:transmembrane protein, putative [Bodo saltans]|eukprot:CUF81839.1 transmembrane protein, putative [Bodo saltans]
MPTVSTTAVPPGQLLSEDPVHARKGYHYFSTSLSMRRVHFFTMMELPQCIDCPRPWWHRDPAHDFDVRSDGSHSAGGTLSFNRVAAYAMAESQLRGGGTGADDAAAFTTAASSFQRQTSVSDDSTDAHPFFTKPLILLVCRRMPCGLVTINPQYRHPDVSGPDADNAQPLNADHPSNRPVLERQLPFNLGAVSCAKLSPSNAFIVVALESGRIVFVSPRISSLAMRQRPPVNPPPFHFSEPLLNRVPATTTTTTAGTHRASLRTAAGRPARAVSTNDAQPATARASHPSSAASASANAHHQAHHFDEADDSVASLHPTSTTGPAAAASADNHATNATTNDEDPLHHSDGLVEECSRSQTEFLQQHSDSVAAATDAQPLPASRRFAPPPPAPRNVGEDEEEDDTDVFDDDEDEDLNEEAQEERRLRISSSAGSTPPASHYGLERPPPADVDTDAASTGSRWSTLRGVSPLPQPIMETTEHFDEVRNFFGSHVFEDPLIKRWQRKNDGVSWDMLHMTTQNDRNSVLLHTTVLFHPTVEHTFLQVANLELDGWKLSTVDTQATVMVFNIETLVHLFTVTLYPVAHHHLPMSRLLVRSISAETSSRPINPKYVVWNNGTMLVSPLPITSHTVVLDFSGQFRVHEELVPIHEVALGRTDEQIAERLRRQKRHGRGTGARRGVGDDASEFPELPVFRPVRQRARPGQATANGASAAAAVDSTLNNTVSGGGRQQLRTSTALEFVQSSGNISHHPGGPGGGQVTTGRRPQHAATTRGAARRQQTLAALRSNPQTSIAIGDGDGQDLVVDDDLYDADDICSKGSDCSSNDCGEDDERLSKVADSEQWLLVNVRYLAKLFGNYGGDTSTYRQWWNARESVLAKIIPLQEFPLMFHVLYIFAPPLVMVMISVILFLVAMRLDEVVSYPFLFPFSLHCLLVPHYFGINVYSYKPLLAHHSGFTFYMRMFADALYLLVFPLIFVLRRDGELMTNISWMVLSAPISIAIVLAFLAARLEDRFELRHHIALDPAGAAQRYRHITGMQAAQTVLVVTFITAISSFFDDPLDDRSVNLAVLVSSAWRDKAMFDPLDTSPDYTMTSLIFIVFTPIWIFTIMYSVHVHTVVPPPVLTNDNPSDDSSGDDDDHLLHAGQQHTNARSVLRRWLRRFSRCTRYARRVTVYGASVLFLHVLYATVVLVPLVGFCLRYDRYVMCSMHPYGVPVLLNTSTPSPTNNGSTNISFTTTTTPAPTNDNSSLSFSGNDTSSSSAAAVGQYVMVAVACGSSDFPLYFVLFPVIFSLILVAGFATSNVIVHVRQLRRGM